MQQAFTKMSLSKGLTRDKPAITKHGVEGPNRNYNSINFGRKVLKSIGRGRRKMLEAGCQKHGEIIQVTWKIQKDEKQ